MSDIASSELREEYQRRVLDATQNYERHREDFERWYYDRLRQEQESGGYVYLISKRYNDPQFRAGKAEEQIEIAKEIVAEYTEMLRDGCNL